MMDRALQERIIGAVVLVVFAILIVPVFLDGPANDAERISESVTLPGQNNQERKQQTIVLERDRTKPVPNAVATVSEQSAPQTVAVKIEPKNVVEEQVPAAEPATESVPEPVPQEAPVAQQNESTTGMWAVQLGSFSSLENAERLAADLRDQGYAAFLSQRQIDSGPLHRVRVGPQKDRESAEEIAEQLGKGGNKGQVVPHP